MRLVIAHLYPKLMGLYGDRGNVHVLRQRCEWRGIQPVVTELDLGQSPHWSQLDIVFIGGGQDREQRLVAEDLEGDRGADLRRAVADGLSVLAVCGGYQLLGQFYRLAGGRELAGVGVFSCWTDSGPQRMVGDVLAVADGHDLVGFENHAGRTWPGDDFRPLAIVTAGFGNNGVDRTEGAVTANAIGTYLHGPVLPKNPWLADQLIRSALYRRYGVAELAPLDDGLERSAAEVARKRALARRVRPNMI